MICFNILACSKSGSRFALAWVGTGFRRLGSLDRKSRSRVRRSSFFPDGSKKAYQRKFDFARISSFLQKPHNINLSFLFFVVCNTWSFHHNLNQSNQFTSFCDYILYCSLHFTSFLFVWKSILHTDHFLISWEAMNRDWLQQKPPARWTHSSLSEETWLSCVCIQVHQVLLGWYIRGDLSRLWKRSVSLIRHPTGLCVQYYVIRGNNVNSEKMGQILFTLFRYFFVKVKIWRRRCFPGRGLNSRKYWTH